MVCPQDHPLKFHELILPWLRVQGMMQVTPL